MRKIDIMPKKIVDVLGKEAGIKALKLPYETPEFEVGLIWNQCFDNDPEHQWFMEMAQAAIAKSPLVSG